MHIVRLRWERYKIIKNLHKVIIVNNCLVIIVMFLSILCIWGAAADL